jgi:hypothetical protein
MGSGGWLLQLGFIDRTWRGCEGGVQRMQQAAQAAVLWGCVRSGRLCAMYPSTRAAGWSHTVRPAAMACTACALFACGGVALVWLWLVLAALGDIRESRLCTHSRQQSLCRRCCSRQVLPNDPGSKRRVCWDALWVMCLHVRLGHHSTPTLLAVMCPGHTTPHRSAASDPSVRAAHSTCWQSKPRWWWQAGDARRGL